MIKSKEFVKTLRKNDILFASGIPDSMTKDLCFEIEKQYNNNHVRCANEGSAIAEAIGFYLKKKKLPLVYMQNSGLGNAINPIISLAHKKIFNIPLFLIIGWRGELGKDIKDEPQHIKQGEVTKNFLNNLDIIYEIIDAKSDFKKKIFKLKKISLKKKRIVALLIRKNSFENKKNHITLKENLPTREQVLKCLVYEIPKNSVVVSTTGILSRELNEINDNLKKINNFMCVGGMGHASSIASGIAKNTKKKVFCFDGDGAFTMHLGSLTTTSKNKNLIHIVFNNGSHESVGGQKTSSNGLKLFKIAYTLGYDYHYRCKKISDIKKYIKLALKKNKSFFLEILIQNGHRKNISRPNKNMKLLVNKFMSKI